jgi:hypothetical protein
MIHLSHQIFNLFFLASFFLLGACSKANINFKEDLPDATLPSTVNELENTSKPACKYTYEPSQICQPNGTQTITVATKSPLDCAGTPITTQSCTYKAPVVPAPPVCSYTYTPTQVCQPNGTQSVKVTSSSPAGCKGTPITTQSCTYIAPVVPAPPVCSYTYTPTQVCQPNGTQSVTVASFSPTGCKGTPVTTQSCTYIAPVVPVPPACSYTYTPTQVCQTNGTQTISVATKSPLGCTGTPETIQSCVAPQNQICPSDQLFSMAQQKCVSACFGKQAYLLEERNMSNDQTAQISFGYNAIVGVQINFNGVTHQFGQWGIQEGQDLTSLGSMMQSSASYQDFVNAFNASINANPAIAGKLSASLGSNFSFILYNGVQTTGQEILLSGNGTFTNPTNGTFWFSPYAMIPSSHQFISKVYCKDQ